MMRLNYLSILLIGSAMILGGCASFFKDNHEPRQVFIPCIIDYDGERNDIPSYLYENESAQCQAHYLLSVEQMNESSLWDWVNPLYPLGYSFADKSLIVEGKLTLKYGKNENKIISSSCKAEKGNSLFSWDIDPDPKKQCIKIIKEDINQQLLKWKKEKK